MVRIAMLATLVGLAGPVLAQVPPPAPVIRVIGEGVVRTPPDVATIAFSLRGEGLTSDDAVRALVVTQTAVEGVLGGKAEVRTGRLAISEARDRACAADEEPDSVQLSKGPCAVIGYVATMSVTAKVSPIKDAGTLLGLAGRAGAIDPRLYEFGLKDSKPAQRAATAAAIADARQQAQAIAAASGASLGSLHRVEDPATRQGDASQDIVVTAFRAPPAATPPVPIEIRPDAIETRVRLIVEFSIEAAPR